MKHYRLIQIAVLVSAILVFNYKPAISLDYMVDLFEEHYKEKPIVGPGIVKIYHSWQVKTKYGSKLIVIIGDDNDYRAWLRNYTKNHTLFIIKIPEGGDAEFKYSTAVLIDVQQIHPVVNKKWKCIKCRLGPPPIAPVKVIKEEPE